MKKILQENGFLSQSLPVFLFLIKLMIYFVKIIFYEDQIIYYYNVYLKDQFFVDQNQEHT